MVAARLGRGNSILFFTSQGTLRKTKIDGKLNVPKLTCILAALNLSSVTNQIVPWGAILTIIIDARLSLFDDFIEVKFLKEKICL